MPVGENSTRVRMTGRDSAEPNRVASRLELLCDLTFVVAVGQLAYSLAHYGDRVREPAMIVPYLMVFFAIWWAWINLAWFASAYDTDDALYRILTAVQMSGVLVLAAGVPGAFGEFDGTGLTVGYLLMRLGQVAQWVRVAVENPEGRSTAVRYGIGIGIAQAGWILLLVLHTSHRWLVAGFLVLVAVELAVPPWAERRGKLSWHPRHIAERYGLFYILLLGESVLAVAIGVREALDGAAVTRTGLADGCADAVVAATAWHWFDAAATLREVRRLLKPGTGGLGLVWNDYDVSVPWVAAYAGIADRRRPAAAPSARSGLWREFFDGLDGWTPLSDEQFPNPLSTTPAGIVDRLLSSSAIARLSEPERAVATAEVAALLKDSGLDDAASITLPYVTTLCWTRPMRS